MTPTKAPIQISVVIPAYNEKKRIAQSVDRILDFLGKQAWPHEVIIVDDGSRDGMTARLKAKFNHQPGLRILHNLRNRGKGASIRRGMAAARGALILFTDADLSTPIEELVPLKRAIEAGADVAIASRDLPGAVVEVAQPLYRELMGKSFNVLVQLLVLPGIHDTQCGFKLFRRALARKVFQHITITGFGFDVEALFVAKKMGAVIKEVPVRWRNALGSKVSPLKDALRMFVDLFLVRWRHRGRKERIIGT